MPVTVSSHTPVVIRIMLGQVFKLPGIALSGKRFAIGCRSAPMHSNLEQQREAQAWQLCKTGNIANLKLQNTVASLPKPGEVTVAVKAVS